MSQIPHDAKSPSSGERITVLPWFVGILQDNETLEVLESGTRSLLKTAHRDMGASLSSPSGHPNRYGGIPFRFPAATELMNVSAISDALMGRRTWESPAVIRERDILFGIDRTEATKLILSTRRCALNEMKQALKVMEKAERRAYGRKSFFYCRDHGIDSVSDDDSSPEEENVMRHPTMRYESEEPNSSHDCRSLRA